MTLRDIIDAGIIIQGQIKLQCCGIREDYPNVLYEGSIDIEGTKAIKKYLDREIVYIFPYTIRIGKCYIGCICIELAEEE